MFQAKLLAIVAAAALTFGGTHVRAQGSGERDLVALQRRSERTANADWKRRSIPSARMSAELPQQPESAGLSLDAQTRKQVSNLRSTVLTFEGVVARFAFVEFVEGADVQLGKAAQGAINNVRAQPSVSDLKSKQREFVLDGVPAVIIEATYMFRGSPVSYLALVAGDGRRQWQAGITFRTASAEQEEIAKRIIESIRLEKS